MSAGVRAGRRIHKNQEPEAQVRRQILLWKKQLPFFPSCTALRKGDKSIRNVLSVSAGWLLLRTHWLKRGVPPGPPLPPSDLGRNKEVAPCHQGRGPSPSVGDSLALGHPHTSLTSSALLPSLVFSRQEASLPTGLAGHPSEGPAWQSGRHAGTIPLHVVLPSAWERNTHIHSHVCGEAQKRF